MRMYGTDSMSILFPSRQLAPRTNYDSRSYSRPPLTQRTEVLWYHPFKDRLTELVCWRARGLHWPCLSWLNERSTSYIWTENVHVSQADRCFWPSSSWKIARPPRQELTRAFYLRIPLTEHGGLLELLFDTGNLLNRLHDVDHLLNILWCEQVKP